MKQVKVFCVCGGDWSIVFHCIVSPSFLSVTWILLLTLLDLFTYVFLCLCFFFHFLFPFSAPRSGRSRMGNNARTSNSRYDESSFDSFFFPGGVRSLLMCIVFFSFFPSSWLSDFHPFLFAPFDGCCFFSLRSYWLTLTETFLSSFPPHLIGSIAELLLSYILAFNLD